jgi:hypothetical protein
VSAIGNGSSALLTTDVANAFGSVFYLIFLNTDAPMPVDAVNAVVNLEVYGNIIVIVHRARLATHELVSDRAEGLQPFTEPWM